MLVRSQIGLKLPDWLPFTNLPQTDAQSTLPINYLFAQIDGRIYKETFHEPLYLSRTKHVISLLSSVRQDKILSYLARTYLFVNYMYREAYVEYNLEALHVGVRLKMARKAGHYGIVSFLHRGQVSFKAM